MLSPNNLVSELILGSKQFIKSFVIFDNVLEGVESSSVHLIAAPLTLAAF